MTNRPNPEYSAARSTRPVLGLVLLVSALGCSILALLLLWGAKDDYPRLAGAVAMGVLSVWLGSQGRRRRIPVIRDIGAVASLVDRTGLPLVLYLRRFQTDAARAHPEARDQSTYDSDEEKLAVALSRACLFVAVGRPGEPLPPWGAYRLYVESEDWEAQVRALIDRADAILMQWQPDGAMPLELEMIQGAGKLAATVFLVPPVPRAQVGRFIPPGLPLAERGPDAADRDAYAAFYTCGGDDKGRLHYRGPADDYGDVALQVFGDEFQIRELDKRQRGSIRGFYGSWEWFILWALKISLAGFVTALGLGMLTVLLVLIVEWLPAGGTLHRVLDGLLDILVSGMSAIGFVLAISLAAMMFLGHLGSRIMPDS